VKWMREAMPEAMVMSGNGWPTGPALSQRIPNRKSRHVPAAFSTGFGCRQFDIE
jgi:hypothetical protein